MEDLIQVGSPKSSLTPHDNGSVGKPWLRRLLAKNRQRVVWLRDPKSDFSVVVAETAREIGVWANALAQDSTRPAGVVSGSSRGTQVDDCPYMRTRSRVSTAAAPCLNVESGCASTRGLCDEVLGGPVMSGAGSAVHDQLVSNANLLDGGDALVRWERVLERWRRAGPSERSHWKRLGRARAAYRRLRCLKSPKMDISDTSPVSDIDASDGRSLLEAFCAVFRTSRETDSGSLVGTIVYRSSLDLQYRLYLALQSMIRLGRYIAISSRSPPGVEQRRLRAAAIAKDLLYTALLRHDTASEDMSAGKAEDDLAKRYKDRLWRRLGRQLEKGQRWHELYRRLGEGAIALIPGELIRNSWVERLQMTAFHDWLSILAETGAAENARRIEATATAMLDDADGDT